MRRSPELAEFSAREHVRDKHGICVACADFTVIPYPCPLAKLARESLNWAGRRG
jgi:hypothetical protein